MAGEEGEQERGTARVRYPNEAADEVLGTLNRLLGENVDIQRIILEKETQALAVLGKLQKGQQTTSERFEVVNGVLRHILDCYRAVPGRFDSLDNGLAGLQESQQKLQESCNAVPGRFDALDGALKDMSEKCSKRLDAVDSGLAGLKKGQEGLYENDELLYTSLAELAQAQEALQRGQEVLKQGNGMITMGIAELEAGHDELRDRQKETSKELADFRRTYEGQTVELYKAVLEGRLSLLTALGNTREVLSKEILKAREKEMEGRVKLLEGQVDVMKYVLDAQKDTSARIDSLGDFLRGQYRQIPSPGTGYDRGPEGPSGGGAPEQDTGKEKQAAPREEPSSSIDDAVSEGDDSAKAKKAPDAPKIDANQLYDAALKARDEGNYEQVLPLLQEAYAEGFDKPYLLNCELGTFLLLTGNLDAAESAFSKLMKDMSISEEARIVAEHNLGCIYEQRDDDFEKADKLRLVEDDDPEFWHPRGDFVDRSASGNPGAYSKAA